MRDTNDISNMTKFTSSTTTSGAFSPIESSKQNSPLIFPLRSSKLVASLDDLSK